MTFDTTPLLERTREVAALRAALERGKRGNGSLVVVAAKAGLGKTRLLSEARDLATQGGFRILRAAGNELEREFPFGVVFQLFEGVTAENKHDAALFDGAAGRVAPMVARPGAESRGPGDEFAMLHGLYWLTANLAERKPLFLAIDDLHWADDSSARFLVYLGQRLEELPVVISVAFRPHEAGAPRELEAIEGRYGDVLLRPSPLGDDATEQVVRLEFPEAESSFTEACRELSGGNPLLLRELLRGVRERQAKPTTAEAKRLAQFAPERVVYSVLDRVRRLPDGALALARAVAVLGPSAHLRTSAQLALLDVNAARELADALVKIAVLRAGDPLQFEHPLLRAAIYEHTPSAQRAAAHGRAAKLVAGEGAPAKVVASHLLLAERAGDAATVRWLDRAATAALADGAPDSAIAYLRRALEEPPPPELRAEIVLAVGRAEAAAGDPHAAIHLAHAVAHLQTPRERALATVELARALQIQGRYLDAATAIDEALTDLDDQQVRRELEATWISVARLAVPLRQRAVERLEAFIAAPRVETHAERLLLAQASGQKVFAGDPREEACALARRALDDGKLFTDGGPDEQTWVIALATFAWSDDFATCERGLQKCLQDARRDGLIRRYATAAYGLNLTHYYSARLSEAAAEVEQAIEARHSGWHEYLPAACGQLAWTLIELDELDAAARALALPELAQIDNAAQVLVFEARARLFAAQGNPRQALDCALQAGRLATAAYVMNPSCLPWRSTAAVASARLGDLDRARELANEELRLAYRFGAPRPIGVALRAAALTHTGATSVELLRESVTTLRASPATLELLRSLIDLGAALRRMKCPADARAPLREALAMAERCGARALERRARDELLASGARPRRRELTGVDSLTPSERRVALMATGGMTNREIAQALFVTLKAVQFHLGNAYRKLDISGRDELRTIFCREARRAPSA